MSDTSDSIPVVSGEDKIKDNSLFDDEKMVIEILKSEPTIKKKGQFYYYKAHPKFQNIHLEVIEDHLLYSREHSHAIANMH